MEDLQFWTIEEYVSYITTDLYAIESIEVRPRPFQATTQMGIGNESPIN